MIMQQRVGCTLDLFHVIWTQCGLEQGPGTWRPSKLSESHSSCLCSSLQLRRFANHKLVLKHLSSVRFCEGFLVTQYGAVGALASLHVLG